VVPTPFRSNSLFTKIADRALLFISDLAAKPPSRIAPLRELLGSTPGNHS
jgi:hypothetical protein